MLLPILTRVAALPLLAHAAAAIATVAGFQLAKGRLDASYTASKHPVDYMTGQTSFSGQTIKAYYAEMQDAGTLNVYFTTQLIDFGFIVAMACVGMFICTLIARLGRVDSLGRRVGLFAGLSFLLGAACDAIENGWSFVMLANPADFANWLALPYSTFASLKFGLVTLGMLLVLVSILSAGTGRLLKKPRIG